MSKIENRCIAYIYNEMDPSERLEFERELQNDENLLIELESLKSTASNLGGLTQIEPPEFVINNVRSKINKEKLIENDRGSYKYLFASAAITLVAVMLYGAIVVQDQSVADDEARLSNDASQASISSGNISTVSTGSAEELNEVSPWVDHDEVIHFHERFNRGSVASVDSMFNNSLEKLTRVNSSRTIQQVQQQIHLTGSNR
jgi:hypothetical protein